MSETPFDVRVVVGDGKAVVRVAGEVDLATAPQLREAVHLLLVSTPTPINIALELSKVSFLDSSGLSVIVAGFKQARMQGGTLTLEAPTPPVLRLLEMTGIADTVPIQQ